MVVVGITGSIGTGKSLAANFFKEKGYLVIDADQINDELLNDKLIVQSINMLLYNENSGILDKKRIAQTIFSDQQKRKSLENYLHPIIFGKMKTQIETSNEKLVFLEIPLLYEAKFDVLCDYVLLIYASEESQIERLILRDKIDKKEIKRRINSQMAMEKKLLLADYVINNDGEIKQTINTLKQWLESFLRRMENGYL